MPVDAVLLPLHGAMVAEGYDDAEGDLIERVRAIVGPDVKIGVHIDLHCHLTQRMLDGTPTRS
jgi:microcystin degradation protein MlrC